MGPEDKIQVYIPQLISDFLVRPSAEENIAKLPNKKAHMWCFRCDDKISSAFCTFTHLWMPITKPVRLKCRIVSRSFRRVLERWNVTRVPKARFKFFFHWNLILFKWMMSILVNPLLHYKPPQTWWLETTTMLLFTSLWVNWEVLQWGGTLMGFRG